ncbi:hypothetical protein [uncultured Cohaesibacter sp.]|uniref:head-tail joining protein n=1 Tax=uncultured Cohaesibacter sp. TaxID=1002546 RepID=UPI0029C7748F|nr:hypothetical protein [uncultured Cohaesibacter sp.]
MSRAHFQIAGVEASYQPPEGAEVEGVLVILYQQQPDFDAFQGSPQMDGLELEVLAVDVTPEKGGVFSIGEADYQVASKPRYTGVERDVWRMVVNEL